MESVTAILASASVTEPAVAIAPFQIHIDHEELDLLQRKLELARLPTNNKDAQWGEQNGVTMDMMSETIDFWRNKYNWREEEAKLNKLPQFITPIHVHDFGTLDIHFVHSKASRPNAIPLLFLHGWPGSFIEVSKILLQLNEAGFDVVAPSLPGFGFSSYTDKPGFNNEQYAETMHNLMQKLGYKEYVIQGGDWGSWIVRCMAILYPKYVKAMHLNMVCLPKPDFKEEPKYTDFEKVCFRRYDWFESGENAYYLLQTAKPRTLGFGLHDSPVAMLAWMADKLFLWSDNYPWTPTELITWTLMHYFPGPTTGLNIYHENPASALLYTNCAATGYVEVPTGVSAFPKELSMLPRSWAETKMNVVFWEEHASGGHFAAYERPRELVDDLVKFYKSVWKT